MVGVHGVKGFNSRFGQFKLSKSKIESLSPSPFRSCNLVFFFFFFVEQINAGDFPGLTVVLFTKRPNEPGDLETYICRSSLINAQKARDYAKTFSICLEKIECILRNKIN